MREQPIYNEIPENELSIVLNKAKAGNQEAFSQVYEHYFERIFRFVFYRVSHKETAEDLTEDIFVKIYHKLKDLKEIEAFEGWLFQISRNMIIDYYRTKKITVDIDQVENTIEYDNNLIDTISLEQNQRILVNLLQDLPTDDQKIIKLRFFEDLDSDTIATMLGKSTGAIRVMQHRALAKLKQLLDEHLSKYE